VEPAKERESQLCKTGHRLSPAISVAEDDSSPIEKYSRGEDQTREEERERTGTGQTPLAGVGGGGVGCGGGGWTKTDRSPKGGWVVA